jgi:hypothetical protein
MLSLNARSSNSDHVTTGPSQTSVGKLPLADFSPVWLRDVSSAIPARHAPLELLFRFCIMGRGRLLLALHQVLIVRRFIWRVDARAFSALGFDYEMIELDCGDCRPLQRNRPAAGCKGYERDTFFRRPIPPRK